MVRAMRLGALLLLAVLCLSCAGEHRPAPWMPSRAHEHENVIVMQRLAKAYVEHVVRASPEEATALGIHDRDGELDERTASAEAARIASARDLLERVGRELSGPVDTATRVDATLVTAALRAEIARRTRQEPLAQRPQDYLAPLDAMFLMVARDYADRTSRGRLLARRLRALPVVLARAKAQLTRPPAVFTRIALDRARGGRAFLAEVRAFYEALPDRDRSDGLAAAREADAALVDYASWLETALLPRSDGSFAAGRALYQELMRHELFLDATPEELLAFGEQRVASILAEMNAVAARIDPSAPGFEPVLARVKEKHPTADAILPTYRAEVARARAFLVARGVVAMPPGDDLAVVDTPAFLRTTVTAAYDRAPPFDAATRGYFFVTPVDPKASAADQEAYLGENDFGDIVNTSVHEAYPGHHLQLSFARRHESLARRVLDPPVLAEGWALYTEELMHELGYYDDSARLVQLQWALVRAARVVIDVGLHVQGWSTDDAVRFLTDKVRLARVVAESEARRYTMTPTQPSSYMVGREQIFLLRTRMRARNDKLTLRAFHDALLALGGVPPALASEVLIGERIGLPPVR